jgi:type IV pilus assembly protein PilM
MKSVVGVDIGSLTVRAAEVRAVGRGKPTLVRYHELRLPAGAVSRGEVIEPNTVAAVLRQLWAAARFTSKNVVIGMGNHRVLARDLTVPRMSINRIRESLPFQVQDLLPVPVSDALLDFYPVSESEREGESGAQVTGLLIAAMKEAVQRNVSAIDLAGLATVGVDLIPFALGRTLRGEADMGGTVAQIDIGAGTTSVVITHGGVPHFVRLIPAGGDDLTQALAARLGLGVEEAEELKLSLSLTSGSRHEDEAQTLVREVTTELLGSLKNTVNYFSNTRPDMPVTKIVVTGGGALLSGAVEALSAMTRLPVARAEVPRSLTIGREVNAEDFRQTEGKFLVALGLALGSTK